MSASVRAPEIGASIPKGYHLRPYRPSDRDALMEIQLRNHRRWHPEKEQFQFFNFDDPTRITIIVLADEHDTPVGAVGARMVAEVGTTIDDERLSVHALRDVMMPAWAKLAVLLYKQGFKVAFCRVSSPTPRWVRMLVKRLKWQQNPLPHLYFDLEKTLSDPALKDLYDVARETVQ